MRHVRTDLIPVLAILAGASVSAVATGLVFSSLSTSSASKDVVVAAPPLHASAPPLIYIDGVRVGSDVGAPSGEAWRTGEGAFDARMVRAALSEWFTMTGTSPLEIDGVESIEVLTPSEAFQRYGGDASGGAVVVTLRHTDTRSAAPPGSALPPSTPASFTVPPAVLNIGDVRRAMFASFPQAVLDGEAGGTATVSFLIDDLGEVQETRLDATSGHEAVDRAAMTVAKVFRFSPALSGETPIRTWFTRDLTFDIR